MRLVLASNTIQHGLGPLEHCVDAIAELFGNAKRVAFIGFAKTDQEAYLAWVQPPFASLGIELVSAHTGIRCADVDGVYVGGGNTFLLTRELYDSGWMKDLTDAVPAGLPYLGASAGTNVACPTLCTTNDMPIVQPPSFVTLGLVPFQVNAHYLDADPDSTHKGETREQRIQEYHAYNDRVVVGLREGSWLDVRDEKVTLCGKSGARILRPNSREEVEDGADLSELMIP